MAAAPDPAGGPNIKVPPVVPDPPPHPAVQTVPLQWLEGAGPLAHIAICSRVRLTRNLKGFHFPLAASAEEMEAVLDRVQQAVSASPFFKDFIGWNLLGLSTNERHILVERHLISPLLANLGDQRAPGRAVLVGPLGTLVAMIGEEDHLRLQAMLSGLEPEICWDLLTQMDDELETRLEYAFSDRLGYLAACPTNIGTALRCSVMLHLPALALAGSLETLKQQISGQVGLAVRGLYGEGTTMQGNMLQISNQITLGPSEEDVVGKVKGIAARVVEQESDARQKLRREFSAQLGDKVWRALGILRHAQIISLPEALDLLSLVRLGVDMDILPPIPRARLNHLLVGIRPAIIQTLLADPSDTSGADMMRARRIRQELSEQA
jgi:protein arginine kinase